MKFVLTSLSTALFLALGASAQGPTMNTPDQATVVQCRPLLLTWVGGTPPYFLTIVSGTGGNILEDFGQQNGTQLTWQVNIAAGTSIGFRLTDSTGAPGASAPVTVQPSSDTSCIGQTSTSAGGGGGGGSTSSSGTTTDTGTTTVGATTTLTTSSTTTGATTSPATTTSPRTTSSTTTSARPTTSSPGSARANGANIGMAAVLGGLIAAFLN